MGGRGGGRGRGRGVAAMSFNVEQLGFGRGEALPAALTQPPATFPALASRPLPLVNDAQHQYMLMARKEMTQFWRESSYFVRPPKIRSTIVRYSDRYQELTDKRTPLHFPVGRMPDELREAGVKRRRSSSNRRRVKPRLDPSSRVSKRLDELEKTEKSGDEGDSSSDEGEGEGQGGVQSQSDTEAEPDEDMDDGTDYANNYFDNGENYGDAEDDALEEGPVF